jgi:hypothetical protein
MKRNWIFTLKSKDNDFCGYLFIAATLLDQNTVNYYSVALQG